MLRELCLNSLYFLCKCILKYDEPFYTVGMSPGFHGPLCKSLDEIKEPYGRRLDLWPRGHLKTHIVTVGKSIQDYLRNHDTRILFIGSNEDNSSKNLRAVKYHFENNTLLHWIFPECIPNTRGDIWAETSIVLPREHNLPETTFKAIGVGTRITGWHFDVIIKDDLIDEKTEKSPEVMEKITDFHLLSKNLLESPTTGVDRVIGTRWLANDLYDYIIRNEPEYEVCTIAALFKNMEGEWKSAWPERFTVEGLLNMREKDAYMFSCQQMNNPRDEAIVDFKPQWLKYYQFSDDALNILMEV